MRENRVSFYLDDPDESEVEVEILDFHPAGRPTHDYPGDPASWEYGDFFMDGFLIGPKHEMFAKCESRFQELLKKNWFDDLVFKLMERNDD